MTEPKSHMFIFITKTWNPIGGECSIGCSYCWARKLIRKFNLKKYYGEPIIFPAELRKRFEKEDFVFVSDMRDLFAQDVPSDMIEQVIESTSRSPAKFLFLTKNPQRYLEFDGFSNRCVLGTTIESDIGSDRNERIRAMWNIQHRKMVAIEPIMEFSPEFTRKIVMIQPDFVAIGYDNYGCHLHEPSLAVTEILISGLEAYGIKVYRKTLREKWNG